ncbi:ACT domain-containing protein [Anoxybacterium hadale]|uniref:ACT domain-containing protein n=1 Tax=Anoxybacterium hadale TaxID=3408580 RepID=A0ACD1AH38_9FIRM|nr:ACT domain-containing protein [Clostridiales bacterium]
MLIKQISIFIPNKKGSLSQLTDILIAHHIDIRAIAVFDTAEFGILRIVVDDPDRAVDVLNKEGVVAKVSRVIAVEPEDKPGSLNTIFSILRDADINIEYIYSFIMRQKEMPYVVLKVDQQEKAVDELTAHGINVVNKEEIYGK